MRSIVDDLAKRPYQSLADEEKKLLALFKDYRLLKKLFALELVPEDYKTVLDRTDALRPATMVRRFVEVNRSGRVRETAFGHEAQLGRLFETVEVQRGRWPCLCFPRANHRQIVARG